MRVGNLQGRPVIVTDAGAVDVAVASGGALPSTFPELYDVWDALGRADLDLTSAAPYSLEELGAPSPRPRQVFAIGLNYASHAAEAAFDRTWDTTLGIANGLGLHDNDRMFSSYVISPGGYQVEVGYGARTIVEPWTENRKYDRISVWGHQPLRLPT